MEREKEDKVRSRYINELGTLDQWRLYLEVLRRTNQNMASVMLERLTKVVNDIISSVSNLVVKIIENSGGGVDADGEDGGREDMDIDANMSRFSIMYKCGMSGDENEN